MKTIQLQIKVLEWPKQFPIIKNVLVTCNNEDDTITNKGARVAKTFPHYKECPRHLQ